MESLGYQIVGIVLIVVAAALIWSVVNRWQENRSRSDTRPPRRKSS